MNGEICRGSGVVGTEASLPCSQTGPSEDGCEAAPASKSPTEWGFSVEEWGPGPIEAVACTPALAESVAEAEVALGLSCFRAEVTSLRGSFFLGMSAYVTPATSGGSDDRMEGWWCTEGTVPSGSSSPSSSPDCEGFGGATVMSSSGLSWLRLLLSSAAEGRRWVPGEPACPCGPASWGQEKRHSKLGAEVED